ncbi:MAG: acetyltransferase [Saprospiraceae bacterium]|nr:acetyltransferase [Saprospiraceae bacterium]
MNHKQIYILGDNKYALSMIFETISLLYGLGTEVGIVCNRPFTSRDEEFNSGLLNWRTILSEDFYIGLNDICFLAGMSPESRQFLIDIYKEANIFKNLSPLIHPSTSIAQNVAIQNGVRIEQGTIIGPYADIGKYTLINRGAIIGHHTTISENVNINPGVILNGLCLVGKNTTIGSGAIINEGIKIGANCVIGSGSLVTRDIPDDVVAYGSPAKIIRDNTLQ